MTIYVIATLYDDFTWGNETFVDIPDDVEIEPGDSLPAYAIRQAVIDDLSRMMVDIGHPDGDTENISRETHTLAWIIDEEPSEPEGRQMLCRVFICAEPEYHQLFETVREPKRRGRMEWVPKDENGCDCDLWPFHK